MKIIMLTIMFIALMVLIKVDLGFGQNQCAADEFSCKDNVTCAENSAYFICDGIIKDCPDGDDEAADFCGDCQPDEFLCWNGTCINGDWKCDGETDCEDDEDELLCPQDCRSDNAYECKYLRECLYWQFVCDGEEDCAFGDDETEEMCSDRCGAGNITCPGTPVEVCLPSSTACDGKADCPGATDEFNFCNPDHDGICKVPGYLRCGESGGKIECIDPTFKCDGEYDCPNHDDEPANCSTDLNCNGNFQCNQTTCVSWIAECDGENDCSDGIDELPTNTICGWCSDAEYRCYGGTCIATNLVCDGYDNCLFYDDEDFCGSTTANMTKESSGSSTPIMNIIGICLGVASALLIASD